MKRRKRQSFLKSRYVPYTKVGATLAVTRHLPVGPGAVLTAHKVARFVKETKRDPEVRLAVLGTLRAHSVNGAETPLAGVAVMFAGLAVFLTVSVGYVVATTWAGLFWVCWGAVVAVAAVWVVRMSFAAHARRVVAIAWLGAYEDALRR